MGFDNTLPCAFSLLANLINDNWIIDTGASRHMCTNLTLMRNLITLKSLVTVSLPNGSVKHANHSRQVVLSSNIILQDIYSYHLSSTICYLSHNYVSSSDIRCVFSSHFCYIYRPFRLIDILALGS